MTKHITENELKHLIKQLNLNEFDVDSTNEFLIEKTEHANEIITEQDGWIQVYEQTIVVRDAVNDGNAPAISSKAPVKLIINHVKVESDTIVSSTDRIRWEIHERPLFEITVSEEKLSAYFHLRSRERYAWRLLNKEPASHMVIEAEEDKNMVLETIHLSDVVAILEQKSIKSNLYLASIQQELFNPTHQPVLIAKGKAAIPGKDAELEIYFSQHVESHFCEVSGHVDYRNHLQIPSVRKGEIIARKIPMVDGTPGYDVYGNIILPKPPKDILIVAKSSVELTPVGEVIALREGRPRITGDKIKTFDISTSHIVSGDVDIGTGNVVFSGDVVVYGNVTDHMIIESLGNVYISGGVYNAMITATGSIHVKGNIIGSKLYSGYFGVMFNRLYNTAKKLSELIEKLLTASNMLLHELEARKQSVRYVQIVLLLIENKFNELPITIKELLFVISNIQHLRREEHQRLKEMSEIFLHPAKIIETGSYKFIKSFLALLKEVYLEVARMQEEKAEININQCHNSDLKSNGDIVIQREGVLQSDLFSANNIVFIPEFAVCRGSKLEAGDSISAKVIDGQIGAVTLLKAKRKIMIKKMYSGRICIGKYCTEIFEPIEDKTFDMNAIKKRA